MAIFVTGIRDLNFDLDPSANARPGFQFLSARRGPIATPIAAYPVTVADETILAAGGALGVTVTLPTAVGIAGRRYTIVKTDNTAGAVTIATTGTETINGTTPRTLAAQYDKMTVMSDNVNWLIVG